MDRERTEGRSFRSRELNSKEIKQRLYALLNKTNTESPSTFTLVKKHYSVLFSLFLILMSSAGSSGPLSTAEAFVCGGIAACVAVCCARNLRVNEIE